MAPSDDASYREFARGWIKTSWKVDDASPYSRDHL